MATITKGRVWVTDEKEAKELSKELASFKGEEDSDTEPYTLEEK